jgi:hypothetical protein
MCQPVLFSKQTGDVFTLVKIKVQSSGQPPEGTMVTFAHRIVMSRTDGFWVAAAGHLAKVNFKHSYSHQEVAGEGAHCRTFGHHSPQLIMDQRL